MSEAFVEEPAEEPASRSTGLPGADEPFDASDSEAIKRRGHSLSAEGQKREAAAKEKSEAFDYVMRAPRGRYVVAMLLGAIKPQAGRRLMTDNPFTTAANAHKQDVYLALAEECERLSPDMYAKMMRETREREKA